jgi:hypothetical protein
MSKLCVSKNKTKLVKTSKLSAFCYEFFDQRFFFYFTKILCLPRRTSISKYRSGYLKLFKNLLKTLLINQGLQHKTSSLGLQKFYRIFDNVKKKYIFRKNLNFEKNEIDIAPFWTFYPELVTDFVNQQLKMVHLVNLKKNIFARNLQINILSFIKNLLFQFGYSVLGLKIICTGR